jgi:glycosyltransferase involved in cell wall biosynthesis
VLGAEIVAPPPAVAIEVIEPPPIRPTSVVTERPVVSCLMPTFDRAEYVPRAIEYFLRQDLAQAELIVIDDSPEPIEELVPEHPRVRLIQLEERRTIGAKRNLGAEVAQADLLANWDDDDWYAPWRLSYQVEQMSRSGADVGGLDRLLYVDLADGRAWRYIAPASLRTWLADPTLVFTHSLWKRNPFPDTSMGIDCRFLWHGVTKRMLSLDREDFYVGLIHRGNTSPKDTRHRVWHPLSRGTLDRLMGDDLKVVVGNA